MSTSRHSIVSKSGSLPTLNRFGSYYGALAGDGKERELMFFAKQKLLDGPPVLTGVNGPGSLACFSMRFAL
jgi:hypothetical protein